MAGVGTGSRRAARDRGWSAKKAVLTLISIASLSGCYDLGLHAPSHGGDAGADADTDTDVDTDTYVDTDADTETDTHADTDTQCAVQDDFTPCEIVTEPDLSYDICISGVCQSPGCGTVDCNAPGPHFPLADTNQRTCYDNGAALALCPEPADDFYGQDAQFGWDTSHESSERFYRNTAVGPLVTDNVTGLMWQGCTGGLSDPSCASGTAVAGTWILALAYCNALSWGGYADWRLPDEYELLSIVNYGKSSAPLVDETAFPAMPSGRFWSSSTRADDFSAAWTVDFTDGYLGYQDKIDPPRYIRCIRGGPMGTRRLEPSVISGYRVVADTATGLTWQGCPAGLAGDTCDTGEIGVYSWADALAYCTSLSWAGYTDWRLPNVDELRSIVDNHWEIASIDWTAFPATPASVFWSSSSRAANSIYAWWVSFDSGYVAGSGKASNYRARCVRGGT